MTQQRGPDIYTEQVPEAQSVSMRLTELVGKVLAATRKNTLTALAAVAYGISSPAAAQTAPRVVGEGQESIRFLQKGELPKPVLVTPGGEHKDQGPKYTVTSSVSSPSASATEDKGEGQIAVLADGRKISFVDIGKLKGKEKDDVINTLSDADYARYEKYLDNLKQAANQRIDTKKGVEQAANQEGKELTTQLIGKYEQYISNIEKGAHGERKTVQEIAESDISPKALKERAKALLSKKDVVLAGM